jgi:hypothetical protein
VSTGKIWQQLEGSRGLEDTGERLLQLLIRASATCEPSVKVKIGMAVIVDTAGMTSYRPASGDRKNSTT